MREVGRLLDQLRKNEAIQNYSLADFFVPARFEDVVPGGNCQVLCAFDDHVRQFKVQSLALKIGHILKKYGKHTFGRR